LIPQLHILAVFEKLSMEVCSAVSGETLAFFDVDAFQGKSAKAVKQSLAVQIGVPRFRQRLFREDSSDQIPDEEFLSPPLSRSSWSLWNLSLSTLKANQICLPLAETTMQSRWNDCFKSPKILT
jgi:hypothetical protein